MSFDELLASAKKPEAVVPLCLRTDLQAEWEQLDRELSAHQAGGTLAASPDEVKLAKRIKELEDTMAESTLEVRFRGLGRKAWLKLVAENPPRRENQPDLIMGFNTETMFDSLIRESIVSPELSEDQLDTLLDAITSKQYDNLADAAWNLTRADKGGPVFSQAASRVIPTSDEN